MHMEFPRNSARLFESDIETEDQHIYPLKPSELERQRLELQNILLLRTTDNVQVHAPIELSGPGASVLESGTATGAWLSELAKTVPRSTELVGIDIGSSLFTPAPALSSNVTLHEMSILSLPSEWVNKFSLVHQRLLFASLRHREWITAINNMYNSLKPGGWIQLFEIDEWINAGPFLQVLSALMENTVKAGEAEGLFPKGHLLLSKMVREAGFVDVSVRWFETPVGEWAGSDGADMGRNLMYLTKAIEGFVLQNDGFGVVSGGEEGYRKWEEDFEREIREGSTKPASRWAMILAKKPVVT